MRALDPRTPVIVGVGQVTQKLESDFDQAREPALLMEDAVRRAAADAGAPALLASIDRVGVVGGVWGYPDAGRLVAEAVGSPLARTLRTRFGGNMPQSLLSDTCARVTAGELDVAVCVGGEAVYSRRKLREAGSDLQRTRQEAPEAAWFGEELPMNSEHEVRLGLDRPVVVYPMFDTAVGAARRRSGAEHLLSISEMWRKFNEVAVHHPNAWSHTPMTAADIRAPSPQNRLIAWPYTKAMTANNFVDMGAAVMVCSAARAEALGVSPDRWIFPWAGADGTAPPLFSERYALHDSPAIRIAGNHTLELAGTDIDDVAHFDLYACFPSVVQITVDELKISDDRSLTSTGGLSFFGGPLNNFSMHGIASIVDVLREHPGDLGLVHANGGYATKHAFGLYGTEPPARLFRWGHPQEEIDRFPRRSVDTEPAGLGSLESFTVVFGADGPDRALATALMPDGRRALATSSAPDVMGTLMAESPIGRPVALSPECTFDI